MLDEKSFYEGVGQRVKDAREKCGFTQEELASRVSLSRTSITNIEKGRQKMMLHTLVEIATSLSVEAGSLLPELDTTEKETLDDKLKTLLPNERRWVKTTLESSVKSRSKA